jgi:hypothetical protein
MAAKIVENEQTAMAQKVSTLPDGPGLRIGKRSVLAGIIPLVPGGARMFRERLPQFQAEAAYWEERVGTVHDLRFVIFDNDTRVLFASTFDGDWDAYITDFATIVPDEIDLLFHEFEGYPGIHSPNIKDWIAKQQVTGTAFYSAYPNATVRDVWKALKIKDALNNLLDEAAK